LPAVQSAGPSTILVADGFSCREQIAQLSRRWPSTSPKFLPATPLRVDDTASSRRIQMRRVGQFQRSGLSQSLRVVKKLGRGCFRL
jgi:hypothetical protein